MKSVKILDCTLRDGGRIIDCMFPDESIKNISMQLQKAGMDIVEVGFLRDKITYKGNSTFFTEANQIIPMLKKSENTKYTVFIDYGLFDFTTLTPRQESGIDGIRFGFTKNDFFHNREEVKKNFQYIKELGYDAYFQDVNTLGYSDKELLELLEFANEIRPVSFGIVDTYGAMYYEDLERLFSMIHFNLDRSIAINFHSHNNMQLSFALAQRMIQLCEGKRELIVDATLNGMGKCAGNLNTELIVDYMNRKKDYDYDLDIILDIIDEYLYDIKKENYWGYTIPAFMGGIYKAHPNNVIYLTEKFRMNTKDIRHIISMIDENARQRYDYDNIQKLYTEYVSEAVEDEAVLNRLKESIGEKKVLILVPGHSLIDYQEKVREFIEKENPWVISVNFVYDKKSNAFFANQRRYHKTKEERQGINSVITSNISADREDEMIVNWYSYISDNNTYFDNSTIMLLNLLKKLDIKYISIAGFDGFDKNSHSNFADDTFYENRLQSEFGLINEAIEKMLYTYKCKVRGKMEVEFLTPSKFDYIFLEERR